MARVAADPGGSRVMEAVLESPSVNAKAKKKLLKKLTGYYGSIASTPAGNFLVEKCYSFAVSLSLPLLMHASAIVCMHLMTTKASKIYICGNG